LGIGKITPEANPSGRQWIEDSEMAKLWVRACSTMVAIAASMAVTSAGSANEPPTAESAEIPKAMNEIFFSHWGPYSNTRTLGGQLNILFGFGGFPERRIQKDADAVGNATAYLLEQQATAGPTLRVPDLLNPYETSVQYLPAAPSGGAISGSEFIFESGLTP
jgi:hypothetical protein